jgi:hypothetical protein
MRVNKVSRRIAATAGTVLSGVLPVTQVLGQNRQSPLALIAIGFPSFQDLLRGIRQFDRWWNLLLSIAVVVVLGGVFYLALRLRSFMRQVRENGKKVGAELTALRNRQPDGEKLKQEILLEVTEDLRKLNQRVQSMDDSLRDLPDQIKDLDTRVKTLEPAASNAEEGSVAELPEAIIEETNPEPARAKPPGQLSIEQMVAWVEDAGLALKPVKATLGLFGNFCFSAEGDNWLAENSNSTGAAFLFPRSDRFETAAHYDMYRDYYECVQPSAGRILIESPATVVIDSEQGGWKLSTKGELSVIP